MHANLLALAAALTIASSAMAQSGLDGAANQPNQTSCPHESAAAPSPAVIAARHAQREACAMDMAKFCANVPRGCGRPMECLRAHTASLSSSCTGAMVQLHAARMQSR